MSQVSTKIWNTIGWIATALVVVSIPFALIDPVMGIFILYAAIVVGGLSGIGVNAKAKFGIATIVASLLLGLIGTHYTSSTGLRPLELTLVWTAFAIFMIPILVSAALLLLGLVRRRYSDRLIFDS
jgi:hypothetical protein